MLERIENFLVCILFTSYSLRSIVKLFCCVQRSQNSKLYSAMFFTCIGLIISSWEFSIFRHSLLENLSLEKVAKSLDGRSLSCCQICSRDFFHG